MAEQVPTPGMVLLEKYLKPNGVTQYRLAAEIGKPQSMITKLVSGASRMSSEMAVLIAKATGTTPEYWMDLDSRYQLSLVGCDADGIERLVDDDMEEEMGFYESNGWTYTEHMADDAMIGRAIRGVMMAASETNEGRSELLSSVGKYMMYGIISVPGYDEPYGSDDEIPFAAMGMFAQFLVCAGESPEHVRDEVYRQRCEIVARVREESEE